MDLFQIVAAIAAFLAAGAITMLFRKVFALEKDLSSVQLNAVQTFVTKTDYKNDIFDLKADIKEILRELRNKADRDE